MAARSSRPPPPLGVVRPTVDPMDRIMRLGQAATTGIILGILFTVFAHGVAAARAAAIPLELIRWNSLVGGRIKERLWATYDVDLIKQAPPAKVEPPKQEPEEAKPQPVAQKPAPKEDEPPPPPPAPAQAGKILAADQDPNEPVDLTNSFVQGAASAYAGGFTAPTGTATTAVQNPNAKPGGVPGGTGTAAAPPPPGPDKSRPAGRIGSDNWDCPFPSEADSEQIDEAKVMIEVAVRADGTPEKVTVKSDPGHGFGREARNCAMRKRYTPALDREGNPIPGNIKPFNVHFTR